MSLFAIGLGVAPYPAEAQLASPTNAPIVGPRMPALSPDGKKLAFVYRGDIWLASSKGGHAIPLTQHIEADAYPIFSPDGQWIAFGSKRNGNWDIYAIPAQGGAARQLTWNSGTEVPYGWSPDGKYLLFSGKRESPNYAIFSLDVNTLRCEVLCEDYATMNYPSYSPDGRKVVYGRHGFTWTRPRYSGSAAAQIYVLDMDHKTERRRVSSRQFQHLWTRFMPDGERLLTVTVGEETPSASNGNEVAKRFVDTPQRTPNLWAFDLEGHSRQLTFFKEGSVRWPSVAAKSGDVAFEYGGDLWHMKDGKGQPSKLTLFVAADEKQTTRRREKLSSGVGEAEPSPDGKTFAFGLRGDIWTVPIERPKNASSARNLGFAKRMTDWVGDDSDFSWSPDGKKMYFISDREFTTRIYELDIASGGTKPLWTRNENVTGLRISPDGKQLGFWVAGKEGGLFMLNLQDGQARRVVRVPGPQWRGMGGGEYSWSPDMRWVAYSYRGESRAWNLWIVPIEGGEPVNVTRLYAQHSLPAWSPDGKYLFFQSNRDGEGLYVLPLTQEISRTAESDLKYVKPTNSVQVEIEFEDISRRIRKVSSQSPQADLLVTIEGLIVFASDGDLWSVTYDGKETKRLTTGGGKMQVRVSKDGKKAFFVQNGELYTMSLESRSPEKVSFQVDWERDVQAERKAAFTQFWLSYERGFYDDNFHGRDWEGIRRRYEPLLDSVETSDEFATLLQMLVGELECSHAEVSPAASPNAPPAPSTPHLGFTFEYSYPGPGIKVDKVPFGAPGWYSGTRISPGEIVLAINGKDVSLDEKLFQTINDKQDRDFEFLVNTNADKATARTVRYKALSQGEWEDLVYRDRTDRLRKYVENRSYGHIGYLHISAMGQNNQMKFQKEAYEYIVGKDAMIIDVRFNGGGNIADTLIDWLERKPHGYVRPRDGEMETSPYHAWVKPIIVLMNEHSYSNAEIFSYAMRARGLARLVGMPTPGYVIWTDSLRLVDGTGARMPQSGSYRLDGTPQENLGEVPDVQVPLSPEDWLADRDPQLDKAIELLNQGDLVDHGTPSAKPSESKNPGS